MTHLLSGRSPLTLDWLEKICQALKIDPARLFDWQDGPLARSAYDVYDKPAAALHERFQALLDRGLDTEMAAWIELTEKLLKLCRAHFAQLVLNAGAEEGVLWRRRDSGLQAVFSSLEPFRLKGLQAEVSREGWQEFSVGEFELWLKNPRQGIAQAQSELFLKMWSDLVPGQLLRLAGRLLL